MDREDIIRMVATYRPREAGISESHAFGMFDFLEHFAAIVAAAERDRMCQQFNIPKELAYEKATGNEAD